MEVILAKSAGFCFGVQRAVDIVLEQAGKHPTDRRIYTYGPIIHNREVVKQLEEKGVYAIHGEEDLKDIEGQILIIRSHGVRKDVYDAAEAAGITVVDATCPFVKKIHTIVEKDSSEGRTIVIIGDPAHPEVTGIMGWVRGDVRVIENITQAKELDLDEKCPVTVVSQTTFSVNKFNNIVEIIKKRGYDIRVMNTICSATGLRQKEAGTIAQQVDMMLVVGDKHSSNTQKLYDICRSHCTDTYYIQTIEDLDEQNLQSGMSVGITAGASTPNNIIQEVFLTCQKKKISTR